MNEIRSAEVPLVGPEIWDHEWNVGDDRIIAIKEAWAATKGAKELIKGGTFTMAIDNLTALFYLKKGGGRVLELAKPAWELTRWLVEKWQRLTGTFWIPSSWNQVADRVSRQEADQEYANPESAWLAFLEICT